MGSFRVCAGIHVCHPADLWRKDGKAPNWHRKFRWHGCLFVFFKTLSLFPVLFSSNPFCNFVKIGNRGCLWKRTLDVEREKKTSHRKIWCFWDNKGFRSHRLSRKWKTYTSNFCFFTPASFLIGIFFVIKQTMGVCSIVFFCGQLLADWANPEHPRFTCWNICTIRCCCCCFCSSARTYMQVPGCLCLSASIETRQKTRPSVRNSRSPLAGWPCTCYDNRIYKELWADLRAYHVFLLPFLWINVDCLCENP